MWNAIVRRSSGGERQSQETQFIELNDDDCKLLVAAGLKIQKGASPRDLYCFQYLPTYYDGTPLQVLRLLEEVKAAGRQVRRAAAQQAKRQRLSVAGEYAGSSKTVSSTWQRSKDVDVELLEEDEQENVLQEGQLPELIKIRSFSMASKAPPSPVKGSVMYHQIETPVKPSASRSTSPAEKGRTPQTASRRSQRSSMKIDVVSVQEETGSSSSRKRKTGESSTSTSPLAALFSPHGGIKTPSPGLKTRRSSVLKEFETPDQSSEGATPPTAPAQPKRISLTSEYTETVTKRFTTSEWEDDHEELLSEASASDGLADDSVEDDERGCCDVKSVVEPILDVLQRTSSRFQNAWEEVRGLSSSLVLVPVCDEAAEPSVHVADVRDDAVDLLVFQGDSDDDDEDQDQDEGLFQSKQVIDPWAKPVESGGLSVRTRRQRREIRRLSAASTWRLW